MPRALTPQPQQWPRASRDRVALGKREARHSFLGGRVGRRPADVPMLIRRVCAHHKEIIAGSQAAVAGAGREQGDVARPHRDFVTTLAAQHKIGGSTRKSEHFMRG